MSIQEGDTHKLDSGEQQRIDGLFSAARTAHYLSVLTAAASVALLLSPDSGSVELPLLPIILPRTEAAVALYVLTIASAVVADRMFRNAHEWIDLDPRRPQYAWFPLGSTHIGFHSVSLWLATPIIATSAALAYALGPNYTTIGLSMAGIFLAAMPRVSDKYLPFLRERRDHRGGPATLSIWCLYWYRILRAAMITLWFLLLVLASAPAWRDSMLFASRLVGLIVLSMFLVRGFAGFLHKRIDSLGPCFGFPESGLHDRAPVKEKDTSAC